MTVYFIWIVILGGSMWRNQCLKPISGFKEWVYVMNIISLPSKVLESRLSSTLGVRHLYLRKRKNSNYQQDFFEFT